MPNMSQISQLSVSASVCPTDLQTENHQYHTPVCQGAMKIRLMNKLNVGTHLQDWERKYLVHHLLKRSYTEAVDMSLKCH